MSGGRVIAQHLQVYTSGPRAVNFVNSSEWGGNKTPVIDARGRGQGVNPRKSEKSSIERSDLCGDALDSARG